MGIFYRYAIINKNIQDLELLSQKKWHYFGAKWTIQEFSGIF
jgi:hypothetical protein